MAGHTLQTLADASGVDVERVGLFVEMGVVRATDGETFSDGDARRIRIVESLIEGGLPIGGLAEAFERGLISLDFVDQPSYERFAAYSPLTFRDLSEQSGVPLSLLVVMREALGYAEPSPEDQVRETELLVVPFLKLQVEAGVRPALVERSLRTMADHLRRIAESEADWWRSDILGPLFARDVPPHEIGRRTADFAEQSSGLGDTALMAIYHSMQSAAWMRNIFQGFEAVLERADLHAPIDRPPAICFLDLSGYTRLTEERGDEAAADLAARLARLVQRRAAAHGGRPVKWLGDGVMFVFPDPAGGVAAALEMVDDAREGGMPPAHVGLHAGPVFRQEGDYFGRTVNTAARIADYARQGEVVVSQEVVDASTGAGIEFDHIGPVDLKGLSGPVTLYSARSGSR